MINLILSINLILGIGIIGGTFIVYYIRFIKPEIVRDIDMIGITLGLLYSVIIMIHGWRLDPILLFSQVIICSLAGGAGYEAIRLRGGFLIAANACERNVIAREEENELYLKKIEEYQRIINKLNKKVVILTRKIDYLNNKN